MRRALLILLVPALILGLSLAACSGDDGDDQAQDVSGVENDDTGNDSDSDSDSDSDEPSGDPDEYCALVTQANEDAEAALTDPTPSEDPLADALAQIEDLREVAPNQEVDDALGVYADTFTKIDALDLPDNVEDLSNDPLAALANGAVLEMVQIMLDPALLAASATLSSSFVQECGVALAPSDLGGYGLPSLGGLEALGAGGLESLLGEDIDFGSFLDSND